MTEPAPAGFLMLEAINLHLPRTQRIDRLVAFLFGDSE